MLCIFKGVGMEGVLVDLDVSSKEAMKDHLQRLIGGGTTLVCMGIDGPCSCERRCGFPGTTLLYRDGPTNEPMNFSFRVENIGTVKVYGPAILVWGSIPEFDSFPVEAAPFFAKKLGFELYVPSNDQKGMN